MKILSIIGFIREFLRVTWYSVSSQRFYPDLYKNYKGYGIKYIATILSFTSLIYLLLSYGNLMNVKHYLTHIEEEDNPIEFMVRQWPEITYSGSEISWSEEDPVLITSQDGKVVIAIDPQNKLTDKQSRKIPIIFKSKSIILSVETQDDKPKARPKEFAFGYKKLFGKEEMLINSDSLRDSLVSIIESVNVFILILLLPILILVRLALHIFSNLFSILLLHVIFAWMKLKPSIKSSARIMLFATGAAEVATAFLILAVPQMAFLGSMIEYWAIILAIYSISKAFKPKGI